MLLTDYMYQRIRLKRLKRLSVFFQKQIEESS